MTLENFKQELELENDEIKLGYNYNYKHADDYSNLDDLASFDDNGVYGYTEYTASFNDFDTGKYYLNWCDISDDGGNGLCDSEEYDTFEELVNVIKELNELDPLQDCPLDFNKDYLEEAFFSDIEDYAENIDKLITIEDFKQSLENGEEIPIGYNYDGVPRYARYDNKTIDGAEYAYTAYVASLKDGKYYLTWQDFINYGSAIEDQGKYVYNTFEELVDAIIDLYLAVSDLAFIKPFDSEIY